LQLERELLAHSSLRHPHIVKFHQVFLSPNHCNLVLEYVPGENTAATAVVAHACVLT
jgi:serine/threonine protein kinase